MSQKRRMRQIRNTPLRRHLLRAEKSQAWLSSATGINAPTISGICNGRVNPTPDELQRIAAALSISQEELR